MFSYLLAGLLPSRFAKASPPVPFGLKMGWIAVPSTDAKSVAALVPGRLQTPAGWRIGIDEAYGNKKVFVTPPIEGWVCIVGMWVLEGDASNSLDLFEEKVVLFSKHFGEAQGYGTHRVVEYHHWIKAKRGDVVRSFAYVGDNGLLRQSGEITLAEKGLQFENLENTDEEKMWFPSEQDVMTVASGWSFDPTTLSSNSGPSALGILVHPR